MTPNFIFDGSIVLEQNTCSYWHLHFSDPEAANGFLAESTIILTEGITDALGEELYFESKTSEIDVFADFHKKLIAATANAYHTSIDKVIYREE